MARFTEFINYNVAGPSAQKIVVYNPDGEPVGTIALGRLTMPRIREKLYSFGALSDVHITYDTAAEDFRRALIFLNEDVDVAFTCISGDLTSEGYVSELAEYKRLVDKYSADTPVYAVSGNHEATHEYVTDDRLLPYTGKPLYYSFAHGDDVFIMCGEYGWSNDALFAQGQLQWLYETLEENRNKRCFVFFHVFPWGDCGNAAGLYAPDISSGGNLFTGTHGSVFQSLLVHYKNVTLFHGHSHLKFELQELDDKANISEALGFRSVHVPSLAMPRDANSSNTDYVNVYADSEGYVVDVYPNGVHLRGRDFVKGLFLPIASYWMDTPIREVEDGTYYDITDNIRSTELKYALNSAETYFSCTGRRSDSAAKELVVAGHLNGLPVISIATEAFRDKTSITSVDIREGVESIGNDAFRADTGLVTVKLPNSLTKVGDGSFRGCSKLQLTELPEGITTILDQGFYGCSKITLKQLPQKLTRLYSQVFRGCSSLELTSLPQGITVIEQQAFYGCTKLALSTIPAAVKTIEALAFNNCTGLTEITFEGTPTTINAKAFEGCTNLTVINVPWNEGDVADAPWGATNATINYGHTLPEYIEMSDAQYIDTGFRPNNNTRVVADLVYTNGNGQEILGARNTTSSRNFALLTVSGNWRFAYGNAQYNTGAKYDKNRHVIDMNKNTFSVDGQVVYTAPESEFTVPATLALGAVRAATGMYLGYGRFYSCKIYDDGVLVRDLIPWRTVEGEVGMFDLVNRVFYGNAGTGTFITA